MKKCMIGFKLLIPGLHGNILSIVTLVFGLLSINTAAQDNLYFEHFTHKNGLVQSNLNSLLRDYKGFVWMGSSDGLYKWDGINLTIFQNDKEDSTSISSNAVTSLFQEPDSSAIWIGTLFGGINRWNFATGHFKTYYPYYRNHQIKRFVTHIDAITRVNDQSLMIGSRSQGLFLLRFLNDSIETTPIGPSSAEEPLRVFKLMRYKDQIMAGTSRGLYVFSNQGEVLYQTTGFLGPQGLEDWFKDFAVLPTGKLLIATNNQVWFWDSENKVPSLIKMPKETTNITKICLDHSNRLWIGTFNKGLYSWDFTTKEIKSFNAIENINSAKGMVKNNINDLLFYDKQPILMAATPGGLTTIDFNRLLFHYNDLKKLSGTGDYSVQFIMKDSHQRTWMWISDGLFMQKEPSQKIEQILKTDLSKNINIVTGGWESPDAQIYFTTSNGLLKYNPQKKTKEWIFFKHPTLSFSTLNNLSACQASDDGTLWLASNCGAIAYDLASGQDRIYPFPFDRWGLKREITTDIMLTHNNKSCWIGTKEPYLIHLDTSSGLYKKISTVTEEKREDPILGNYITSMDTDSTGRLWLATMGGGLLYLNEEDSTLDHRLLKSPLSKNTYSVRYGADKNLWVTTDYGLCRLNLETDSLNEFNPKDGLYCEGFNERAIFQTHDGTILLGGKNGFVSFQPQKIRLNTYEPPVFISSYTVGNPSILLGGINLWDVEPVTQRNISIPSNKEVISFDISVLNFSNSTSNQIAWKLEGYDKKWSRSTASHIISYSNLAPGHYQLKVKGANNHGVWNRNGDFLNIDISAPFYKQAWFTWMLIITLAFFIILGFWLRNRFLQRQKQLLGKLVEQRTKKLQQANQELRKSQANVLLQKSELELHRNYLEELVSVRTADLEKAKIKAEESDRLKTAFLANMSHEIRTPMNAIVGFSSLLALKDINESERMEFIKLIQSSSEGLLTLINDIIDISRIETGQMVTQNSQITLGPFLQNIFKSMAFEVDMTKKVKLLLDIPPEIMDHPFHSDEYRLRQIIINLIGNALKFTSQGHIKLGARLGDDQLSTNLTPPFSKEELPSGSIIFFVEDTGIGIRETEQQHIFEPFRKAQNSNEKLYAGMGLGLSIVKNIVPILGGQIKVQSHPGKGSIFFFYISDMKPVPQPTLSRS